MSFSDGMYLLSEGKTKQARKLFEEIIETNPDLFWREVSLSMDLSILESSNVTFGRWHQLGKEWTHPKKLDIARRLYLIMITQENALKRAIEKASNTDEKRQLEQLMKRMKCDLARDHCQLGIVLFLKGILTLNPELQAKAEEHYLEAYEIAQRSPTPNKKRAWWNLASSMVSRAQLHLIQRDWLPSFLMAFLSVEMSLRFLWADHLKDFEYTKEEKESLEQWGLLQVTHMLHQCGKLNKTRRKEIDALRRIRNRVMHAKGDLPKRENAQEAIRLAIHLLESYRSRGTRYHLRIAFKLTR